VLDVGIVRPEQWYAVSAHDVSVWGGSALVRVQRSLCGALRVAYPQQASLWLPWLFPRMPHVRLYALSPFSSLTDSLLVVQRLWDEPSVQRAYMEWLSVELGRAAGVPAQWLSVRRADFVRHHGRVLLDERYAGAPWRLLQAVWPHAEWHAWQFAQAPMRLWDDPAERVAFVRWLGVQLGYVRGDDWYQLTAQLVRSHGGERLLARYRNGSVAALLRDLLPELALLPWRFVNVGRRYWRSVDHRSEYVQWLCDTVHVQLPEALTVQDYLHHHGAGLLALYNNSPQALLRSLHNKPPASTTTTATTSSSTTTITSSLAAAVAALKAASRSKGFWASMVHQRELAALVAERLGMVAEDAVHSEQWYRVRAVDFAACGGKGLLEQHYGGSPWRFLCAVYPQRHWLPWRFVKMPRAALRDVDALRAALRHVQETLGLPSISNADDSVAIAAWTRVTRTQLRRLGVLALVDAHASLKATTSTRMSTSTGAEEEAAGMAALPLLVLRHGLSA